LLDSHSRSGGPAVAEELGFNLLVLLLASGRGLRLHQPYALFFVKRFFLRLGLTSYCPGWLQTTILLTSAP
jgi:hypothetical protein